MNFSVKEVVSAIDDLIEELDILPYETDDEKEKLKLRNRMDSIRKRHPIIEYIYKGNFNITVQTKTWYQWLKEKQNEIFRKRNG